MTRPRVDTDPGSPATESTAELAAPATLIGERIDDELEILSVIAGGAFGTVYRARQLGLDREVAVKVPTHEIAVDPVMAKRFAREARAAAKIRHPGVVTIYAVGELADGRPYIAMELVDGEPLSEIRRGGPLASARALRIGRLIASALAETHAAGVVHRDLKPTNILWHLDRHGDDRIVIVDFGIAVGRQNADATRLTAGGLIGTPHYMSPEQAHGEAVDGRSDLYALGCVLYELVTGDTLFDGSGYEVMLSHLGKPAPRASERAPEVSPALDALIADLVAKRPEDRPATADDVVARIDAALAESPPSLSARRTRVRPTASHDARPAVVVAPGASASSAPDATTPQARRRARFLVAGSIAAVVLVAGGLGVAKLVVGHGGTRAAEPAGAGERSYARDDGETTLHMTLPDPVRAGQPFTAHLELWNKLGQAIHDPPVITIQDPRGASKGFSAHAAGDGFEFARRLREPGHYVMRVFPAGTDSELDVELDVQPDGER